jgi:hypothetical protein
LAVVVDQLIAQPLVQVEDRVAGGLELLVALVERVHLGKAMLVEMVL